MLRDFNFCVIDEVDSILIDEARTPLIISGAAERPSAQYYQARGPPHRARGAPRAACRAARARPPRGVAAPGRSSFVLLACCRAAHCREGALAAGAAGRGEAPAKRCSLLVHSQRAHSPCCCSASSGSLRRALAPEAPTRTGLAIPAHWLST